MHTSFIFGTMEASVSTFWNKVDLPSPPVCTVQSKWGKEIRIINGTFRKLLSELEQQNMLGHEKTILTAVINHYKSELRTDKGFQSVNKILHCLKKFEALNLKSSATEFEKTSLQCLAFDYQPSRQMLEYVVVRIHGLIALMNTTIHACHDSANLLKSRMEVGHLPSVALILVSIVSRIWTVSKYLLERAVEWYLLLRPLVKFLNPTKVAWLPARCKLPDTPYQTINAPWLDKKKISSSIRSFLSIYDEPAENRTNLECLTSNDDLGETISRKSLPVPVINGTGNKPLLVSTIHKLPTKPTRNQRPKAEPTPLTAESPAQPTAEPTAEPVKHFFKRKLSRPLSEQTSYQHAVQITSQVDSKNRKLPGQGSYQPIVQIPAEVDSKKKRPSQQKSYPHVQITSGIHSENRKLSGQSSYRPVVQVTAEVDSKNVKLPGQSSYRPVVQVTAEVDSKKRKPPEEAHERKAKKVKKHTIPENSIYPAKKKVAQNEFSEVVVAPSPAYVDVKHTLDRQQMKIPEAEEESLWRKKKCEKLKKKKKSALFKQGQNGLPIPETCQPQDRRRLQELRTPLQDPKKDPRNVATKIFDSDKSQENRLVKKSGKRKQDTVKTKSIVLPTASSEEFKRTVANEKKKLSDVRCKSVDTGHRSLTSKQARLKQKLLEKKKELVRVKKIKTMSWTVS